MISPNLHNKPQVNYNVVFATIDLKQLTVGAIARAYFFT